MFDGDGQGNNKHVEHVISTKTEELEGCVLRLLSVCATETWVKDESDALKVLLAGVETRFREEHAALVEAINEQNAMMNLQMNQLDALCSEVKTMSEMIDSLCSHTGRLGHVERDVPAIAGTVQTVEKNADVVSSFICV